MTLVRALVPEPVSPPTSDGFNFLRALDLLQLPEVLEGDSCPLPQVSTSLAVKADTGAEFLAWDIVDEWGAQSFPASDPPANW